MKALSSSCGVGFFIFFTYLFKPFHHSSISAMVCDVSLHLFIFFTPAALSHLDVYAFPLVFLHFLSNV